MTSLTSAGSIIALTAGVPATYDATGYAALTYTPVGGVESIPAFGATIGVNSYQPLNGPQEKNKGPVNYGSLQVPFATNDGDAGQTLINTAAAPGNNARYAFCVTYPNGAKRYFSGKVFGNPETVGSATNTIMTTVTIEIETVVVKVNGS